jgi:unsaturated rhamnogalacturonyl hydrolase
MNTARQWRSLQVILPAAWLASCGPQPSGAIRTATGEITRVEGEEVSRGDAGIRAASMMQPQPAALEGGKAAPAGTVSIKIKNPLSSARSSETIAVKISELRRLGTALDPAQSVVVDAAGKPILSQLVDGDGDEIVDEIVFQSDFAGGESKTFTIQAGPRAIAGRDQYRVYGRFVRERHDDFAWENDRIAHRMYGPDLETWTKEPLASSGIDAWCKRVPKLVVNDWYMTDDYHKDSGEGADLYSVGKSRGCGGLGIWADNKLYVSRNFVGSRVLANGPIRLIFELTYAPWAVSGTKVSETKRVTLDAGKSFDRFESTFKTEGKEMPLAVAIGIARHKGSTADFDKSAGILRSWEPLKEPNGNLGCAVITSGKSAAESREIDTDYLLVTGTAKDGRLAYHAGFAWDRAGSVADKAAWTQSVRSFAEEVAAPLVIELASTPPAVAETAGSEQKTWSLRVADSVMHQHPEGYGEKWAYDAGLVLEGFQAVWRKKGDVRYYDYAKRSIDRFLDSDGNIQGYKLETYNIDDIKMGKVLFALLAESKDAKDKERYQKTLDLLRSQMRTHPRTKEGAFWHKNIYPHQMWLDGVYMASPFLAKYAATFHEPALFDDVAKQILLAEKYMRDPKTGLLYHGWDESKQQRWANPKTGTSPEFWGRAMGWYAMAVVDVLELLPKDHPKRGAVEGVLRRLATAIASVQDKETGVWWQVLDAGPREKNYREASASSMFVYALSKAIKNGWLDAKTFGPVADRGYQGLLEQFAQSDKGLFQLKSVCRVAGLGGNPYRDGTYDYYTGTEIVTNDPKGLGAFLLAVVERE